MRGGRPWPPVVAKGRECENAGMAGKKYDLRGYQQQVQERITAIETTFDSNILLIAGGSFTLSTGIAAWFKPVVQTGWLIGAWTLWILCLLVILYSHLVGISVHKKVVKLIDDGVEDRDELIAAGKTQTIERINGTTFALLVAGFVSFGVFVYHNAGSQRAPSQQVQNPQDAETRAEEAREVPPSQQPNLGDNSPPAPEAPAKEVTDERQTEAPTTAPGTVPATGTQGEGDDRPAPAP